MIDTMEMATKLYEMSQDMDYMDYEDAKEKTIADLDYALFDLTIAAENRHNHEGYAALIKALATITEQEV